MDCHGVFIDKFNFDCNMFCTLEKASSPLKKAENLLMISYVTYITK